MNIGSISTSGKVLQTDNNYYCAYCNVRANAEGE